VKCHLKLHTDITLHYRPGLHMNAAKVYRLNHRHVVSDFSGNVYACRLQCFDAVGWAAGRASGL